MGSESQLFQRFGRVVPSGTLLFHENDPGEEMFIIQVGKVKISKKVRNIEKTLVVLGKGEFFGEMAILNDKPRSATAEVVEDSEILVIDRKTFETMIRGNAEIALRIIKKLSARLQEADNQIENLMIKDTSSKIVHTLARLADTTGSKVPGGIKVTITPDGLCQKTGVDDKTVKEIVDKLIKSKLVTTEADGLVVADVDKLRKYLEFLAMKEQFGDVG